MAAVNPYLTFNGQCEEAFNFYKSMFGGEFATISQFKDIPSEHTMPAIEGDKIMHVALPISRETILMGSDRPGGFGPGITGDHFSIAINTSSKEEADKLFYGLSEGGTVTMPLEKTFWGAYFGMFRDKFGVQWMVNFDESPQS